MEIKNVFIETGINKAMNLTLERSLSLLLRRSVAVRRGLLRR
jgi:hypothetical protein